MTNVDACELEPAECRRQNVQSVENLCNAAKTIDSHLIHLSTDFIFDGEAGPYSEEDEPRPLSIYGQSKLDAERAVMNAGLRRWAVARTIIVYGIAPGLSRSNVVLWAKSALEKGSPSRWCMTNGACQHWPRTWLTVASPLRRSAPRASTTYRAPMVCPSWNSFSAWASSSAWTSPWSAR